MADDQEQAFTDAPTAQASALEAAEEAVLWRRFKGHGDLEARGRLIEHHLPFARILAGRCYAQRYRDGIGFDEYLQYGSVGLIEAVDRYLPDDGRASFRTYAAHRIRGAILNGLGHANEVNAQLAARQRMQRDRLVSMTSRSAEEGPGDPFGDFANAAIGLAVGFMLDDARLFQSGDIAVDDNCYAGSELRQMRGKLADLVRLLPARERGLITAHYFDDKTFDEIAAEMNLSKGRVSQLHRRALEALLQALGTARFTDLSA